MHRDVPGLPKGLDALGVPPVLVELAVPKLDQLPHQIHEGVEQQVETKQPEQVVGQLQQNTWIQLEPLR